MSTDHPSDWTYRKSRTLWIRPRLFRKNHRPKALWPACCVIYYHPPLVPCRVLFNTHRGCVKVLFNKICKTLRNDESFVSETRVCCFFCDGTVTRSPARWLATHRVTGPLINTIQTNEQKAKYQFLFFQRVTLLSYILQNRARNRVGKGLKIQFRR